MEFLNDIWFMRVIVTPALDAIVLAFILYKGYDILVQTRAVQLFKGALFMVLMYALAFLLNLRTILSIINDLAPYLVIGLAIIFQPELRKIFTRIGQGKLFQFSRRGKPFQLDAVMSAASVLAHRKRGALIAFARSVGQKNIIESGTRVDAEISSALLVTFFSHDTPLHDGAVIVEEGKIVAAGCFLPLSEQTDIRRSFGTRHRAALGLAEESDAVVLVVSEETGAMSLAYDANLHYNLETDEVRRRLRNLLSARSVSDIEVEEVSTLDE